MNLIPAFLFLFALPAIGIGDQYDALKEVEALLQKEYVEPLKDEQLMESALKGVLGRLDSHSDYYTPKEFQAVRTGFQGNYGGLGLEVLPEGGGIKIVAPLDDSPGYKAGLLPGDLIVEVDKKALYDLPPKEAVDRLKGKPGEKVHLLVRRENSPPLEFTITREMIKTQPIRWRKEGDIGYVRISVFTENTAPLLKEALLALKQDPGFKMKGLLLDLRNNPGGILEQGVEVSELFLDKGKTIVSTKGRDSKRNQIFKSTKEDIIPKIPIAVLINGGSASASEIVAGALQDHGRGVILGAPSTGKGSVQTIVPLRNGGAAKYTSALYYTPLGRSIQKTGIIPDVTVERTRLMDFLESDLTKESHSLRAFSNPLGASEKAQKPTHPLMDSKGNVVTYEKKCEELKKRGPQSFSKASEKTKLDCDPTKDFQLLRALDILKGISAANKGTKPSA